MDSIGVYVCKAVQILEYVKWRQGVVATVRAALRVMGMTFCYAMRMLVY